MMLFFFFLRNDAQLQDHSIPMDQPKVFDYEYDKGFILEQVEEDFYIQSEGSSIGRL